MGSGRLSTSGPRRLLPTTDAEERLLVQRLDGNEATFKDRSTAEVDVIIMCTGYLHSYPFLREELRMKCKNLFYPPGLYKGMVWTAGGNNKLFYCGAQDQCYTYTMFEVCALWIVKLIEGEISLPSTAEMEADWKRWVARNKALKDADEQIDFQTDFVLKLPGTVVRISL